MEQKKEKQLAEKAANIILESIRPALASAVEKVITDAYAQGVCKGLGISGFCENECKMFDTKYRCEGCPK